MCVCVCVCVRVCVHGGSSHTLHTRYCNNLFFSVFIQKNGAINSSRIIKYSGYLNFYVNINLGTFMDHY